MIVIADTSPLKYLVQIEYDQILPRLFRKVLVPKGVTDELQRAGAPMAVREWAGDLPAWIDVASLKLPLNPELAFLDLGEREVIQLAGERGADLLLMDERKGRAEAKRRGLRVLGTLGVLLEAGAMRWIDPEKAYRRLLAETTFRSSAALEAQFLKLIQ